MTKEDIIKPENLVYKKPTLMNDNPMHYCPGCSHGVVHKLIAEVIEEMGMEDKAIGISPVGCAVFIYNYLDIDWQEAAHGRAPALATAIKRLWPDRLVFTYQGDGDLACIGTAETIHALNRGENITIIFINNAIYGMTGGQMAPTTLVGMKTATCPYGRDVHLHGYPLKMADIAAQLEGTAYVTRQSVQSVPAIRKAKKAIRKAFENSMAGKGSNLVEIVSTCNSGWKMTPAAANKWMEENMFPFDPLGDLKDKEPLSTFSLMKEEIIIAGFGGQGVLSMGKILAYSGLMEGKEVTWMPAYGPEQRGGTANVTVIVSDEKISSPILSKYDAAIILNQPSLEKFESKVKLGGVLIYDGYGIINPPTRKDIHVYRIDAMDAANEMNNAKAFNMIVLGGLLKIKPMVTLENVIKGLKKTLPERHHHLIPMNEEAIKRGMELIKEV